MPTKAPDSYLGAARGVKATNNRKSNRMWNKFACDCGLPGWPSLFVVGQCADQINDLAANLRVLNTGKGAIELQALGA